MRVVLAVLALCGALALSRGTAQAELAEGDTPPEFEGKEFVNTEPCSFKSLRGHVVLVEIFRTWWGPCKRQVVHLDELQEKYGAKGLKVLAITNEGRSLVDKFVEETGAKDHGIVIEAGDSAQAFGIKSYPTSYLIAADGTIAAAGHPGEAQIEEALQRVRLPPALPKALQPFEPALKKEKFAEVRGKVAKLVEAGTLTSDEDKTAADELLKWIDWLAQSGLDGAKSAGEKGSWHEAAKLLEDTAKVFKGLPQAVEADTQLKALMADKAKKDEVVAWKKLEEAKAKQKEKDLKAKEALPLFKSIATKYENTKAGKQAEQIARRLEEELKK